MEAEKAYLLGTACGDGYVGLIRGKKLRYRFRLAVNDKDFAEKFVQCLKEIYGIEVSIYFYRNRYWAETHNSYLVKDILSYGDFSTKNWRIPQEIMRSTLKEKTYFLRGFFDSEGYVSKYQIGFCSCNLNGMKDIIFLLESIGIRPRANLKYKNDGAYRGYIFGLKQRAIFSKLVGFSIARKQEKLLM